MKKFDKIIEYIPDDLTITVGSGMLLKDVQEILADNNQLLPTNPPYNTRDLVLGLRVVQASGTIIKAGGKVVKNVAGYVMRSTNCILHPMALWALLRRSHLNFSLNL